MTTPTKPKRRRRKRSSKNNYFTNVHEQAIIQYSNTDDQKVRTELYVKYIGPVFDEMVDKIVYTYKFTTLPNIDCLKEECKIWLTTILDKFDPEKNSKAFSYFSVITKNWFIHKVKKNSKSIKIEVSFDDVKGEVEKNHLSSGASNEYENWREQKEFWTKLWGEIDKWEEMKLRENERKVLESIKILLGSVDEIEIFNKKAIYLYMREITGLNTKQIVSNLNRIRARYAEFKKEWNSGDL